MAFRNFCKKLHLLFASAALAAGASAQEATQSVTVTGRVVPSANVAGFDDVPLWRAPFAAILLGGTQLKDAGITNLADIAVLDASVNDAYNAQGYWSNFTIRGYVLDPRANYQRDGLPINAETALWLGNKQSLEILKGTSGIQAGTSAPGGLLNLTVKRPIATLRTASLDWQQSGSLGVALDIGDRAGVNQAFGWRINAAHERLDPQLRASRGTRDALAAAFDWRFSAGSLLEAEFELSRQSQPSQPGISLLGSTVPDANGIDPRINLNNQPWTLPVALSGRTASLRWTQSLPNDLKLTTHAMSQRLRSDDRIAFPFGCSAEGNFDRYCSDGSFDLYDYRSDNERRGSDAIDVNLKGRLTGPIGEHRYTVGTQLNRTDARFGNQAFNFVGVGTIDGLTVTPPEPTLDAETSSRYERSTALYLRDQWLLSANTSLWLGLRHTRLRQHSEGTNGGEAVSYSQPFTTPWLALSHQVNAHTLAYASWGRGIESAVTPNLPAYSNPGQALPALESRQFEVGLKRDGEALDWSLIAFDIERPLFSDMCTVLCTRAPDGSQQHSGLEANASWRSGAWSLTGSATTLRARREDALDAAANALKPANVPERSLRLSTGYQPAAWPGLTLSAAMAHEGSRFVLPDNSASIPSWTRLNLSARLVQQAGSTTLTWRLGVDNATDRRAWREAPFQFGHAYLYPLAPRTWRASLQAGF